MVICCLSTGTSVWSKSLVKDLQRYAAERLLTVRVALVLIALVACIVASTWGLQTSNVSLLILLAAALLVQFRVWDDYADRDYDALRNPGRVMVTSAHARAFLGTAIVAALPIGAAIGFIGGFSALGLYAILLGTFALLYSAPGRAMPRLARDQLVLVKYPVILWLCAPGAAPMRWMRLAIGLYCAVAIFDLWSDRPRARDPAWRSLLAGETLLLVTVLIMEGQDL
jgi:hypothetical protein